jgi:predicted membrane protein
MKTISVILILLGLYLMINADSEPEKPKKHRIESKQKKDVKIERLVEVIDPEYDIKHPKSN